MKIMNILGVDEAGRGCLAGPLVIASVHVNPKQQRLLCAQHIPIRDSKLLSEGQRERVYEYLEQDNVFFCTYSIDIDAINTHGIGWANYEGIKHVIQSSIQDKHESEIVVDGRFPLEKIAVQGVRIRCQVDADATIFPVILAGIVAKVTRDRYMNMLHRAFPHYYWNENKGYGTKKHIKALREHGISPHHRTLFINTALKKKKNR
jgi:ribonuclease HII